ncbi:MAG TPA: hypothetical protein VJQ06_13775 [Rhizomicrobium sp.]|nr:hypothetical protein [Rhizomicrobium sp.]
MVVLVVVLVVVLITVPITMLKTLVKLLPTKSISALNAFIPDASVPAAPPGVRGPPLPDVPGCPKGPFGPPVPTFPVVVAVPVAAVPVAAVPVAEATVLLPLPSKTIPAATAAAPAAWAAGGMDCACACPAKTSVAHATKIFAKRAMFLLRQALPDRWIGFLSSDCRLS